MIIPDSHFDSFPNDEPRRVPKKAVKSGSTRGLLLALLEVVIGRTLEDGDEPVRKQKCHEKQRRSFHFSAASGKWPF